MKTYQRSPTCVCAARSSNKLATWDYRHHSALQTSVVACSMTNRQTSDDLSYNRKPSCRREPTTNNQSAFK